MAFRDTIIDQEAKEFVESDFFYNLGCSVGYGCPNKPNDVRLVQYFLNIEAEYYSWDEYLEVDGRYGGKTWGAIKRYQKALGFNGAGMVSSVPGTNCTSPKTNDFYTIIHLNEAYKFSYPEFWNDPRRDPYFPDELKIHLYGSLPQQT